MKAIKEREKSEGPVAVDEQELRSHVSEVVDQSVEETLLVSKRHYNKTRPLQALKSLVTQEYKNFVGIGCHCAAKIPTNQT